jgi:hypothetical protein
MAAKAEGPKTVKLTYKGTSDDTATVSVTEDKVDRMVATGLFTKSPVRRATSTD